MTDDEIRAYAKSSHAAMYHKAPAKKRSGKTPEAKVIAACIKYLETLDFYVLRTGAGMATMNNRKVQIGRTGGHDLTCCAPNGRFVSIEVKSEHGEPTPAQLRQCSFIERRNGIVIIPHSQTELRAALVNHFGLSTIEQWEQKR